MDEQVNNDTTEWELIFILPNIDIKVPYETDYMAIVPHDDNRIQEIINNSETFKKIVEGFTNDHKRQVNISALIIHKDCPNSLRNENSFIDFRNIVAISAILYNWSLDNSTNITGPLFSDNFDIYPIIFGNDDFAMTDTLAEQGYRSKKAPFVGMPTRGIPRFEMWRIQHDKFVFEQLIRCWKLVYIQNNGKYVLFTRRLFRSLQIAYVSFAMPHKNRGILNDVGVNVALWVSSLEILVNFNNKANVFKVWKLLDNYIWGSKILKKKSYSITYRNRPYNLNLIKFIYFKIYNIRNDFLHGNKIHKNILRPFNTNKTISLMILAPILYKIALSSYLKKREYIFWESNNKVEINKLKKVYSYLNSTYEDALLRIYDKPKKEDDY